MDAFDLVIENAEIFDGNGAPPQRGALGVKDGVIVAMGSSLDRSKAEIVDAKGQALAPGFIDVHTHDDRALLEGDMEAKLSQGVTSVILGNCGVSLAPLALRADPPQPLDLIGSRADFRYPRLADYLAALEAARPVVNAACLVGHSTLRVGAMNRLDRPASGEEIALMRERLGQALEDGAIGLSTGLAYAPAFHAPSEEVIALASLAREAGGVHTTHMRDEGDDILAAMDEAFSIGRNSGIRVVISHFKVNGRRNFGRAVETIEKFDRQRRIQDIALDAYPYAASSTILVPSRIDETSEVLIAWSQPFPHMSGRRLRNIAREWNCSQSDAAEHLAPAGAIYFEMDEADVRRILAYPHTMIGSDGLPHDRHPHPRLWGAFARVLGHYARDVGLFSLAEAIRRMTALPAATFGLTQRGRLAPGMAADMVLFDPARIIDLATYENPIQPARGIDAVWVNGVPAWRHGKLTGNRAGRALRPSDHTPTTRNSLSG
jgi:N-acyl-D-amino-acid deacylase